MANGARRTQFRAECESRTKIGDFRICRYREEFHIGNCNVAVTHGHQQLSLVAFVHDRKKSLIHIGRNVRKDADAVTARFGRN